MSGTSFVRVAVDRDADFQAVLRAAQAGAEWALARLYRDVHPRILRYLRAREVADPDDLAADVWIEAATKLERFRGDEVDLRRWLFTIARRRLVDGKRREARRRTEPVAAETLADLAAPDDPEIEAIGAVTLEIALRRVAALPPDQADVVLLRVLGDLPVEDVAALLGKRPATVRVLQHRALARLSRELSPLLVTR
jgi:RNA polymerase sigma-70 factor, ECF subfamily